MDKLIKLNNQTSGRDKLIRLIQYASKLIWASLANKQNQKELVKRLKELEYTLSTGRKLYRFGRGVDTLYSALSSVHLTDPMLRFTVTMSRINMALYLMTDHLVWVARSGLVAIDKGKWSNLSYKLWLYALVMNLTRDLYEINQIFKKLNHGTLNQELRPKASQPPKTIVSKLLVYYKVVALHKEVVWDTVKNGCDICLPLSQLGYVQISPRTVGILGVISSIAGILPLLDTTYKLSP